MTEKLQATLRDSFVARWAALILIALMMFFAYMFVDVMSPLQSMIEQGRGWTPNTFGTYAASEYFLNVCGFLILAGIKWVSDSPVFYLHHSWYWVQVSNL